MSKKTNYLLLGADPDSKYDTALQWGAILQEDEFLALLQEYGNELP